MLNIDLESQNQLYFKIGYSARKLLRHMMHKATFLSYRPSQIASTAILVAIDLNKVEKPSGSSTCRSGSIVIESFESCALNSEQAMTPKAHNNTNELSENFTSSEAGDNSHSTREKFNSMLLMEEYEQRVQKAKAATTSAVSPPSHAYQTEVSSPAKPGMLSAQKESQPVQTLDKAWTRQTSYYTQVSKTRDILPVLKDLVASLE